MRFLDAGSVALTFSAICGLALVWQSLRVVLDRVARRAGGCGVVGVESASTDAESMAQEAGRKVPMVTGVRYRTLCVLNLALLLFPLTVHAQEPVTTWADVASYATAAVNPTIATVEAFRSTQKACRLGRIALSEGILNGVGLTMKHFILSPRPCIGCAPDGMPSGHSGNSMIGASGWRYGIVFGATTGSLRMQANRHTHTQVAAGLLLGAGSEFAGRLIHCP